MSDFHRLQTADLATATLPKTWIWHGLAGLRQITLFTSLWKTGKTTLLTHLLARRKQGGEFAGLPVSAGASAVISEEDASLWQERNLRLGFHAANSFFCQPFLSPPAPAEWEDFLEHLGELHDTEGLDLVILDRLTCFLPPHAENHTGLMRAALGPVRKLANRGVAVVLVHHPRKDHAPEGMLARGVGELQGAADILMEMYPLAPDNSSDRRRRLANRSRESATPRSILLEFKQDDSGYDVLTPLDPNDLGPHWPTLRIVLEDANHELTCTQVEADWPADYPKIKDSALHELLKLAHERGQIGRIGAGHKSEPYRYFLPEKMAKWQTDPLFSLGQQMRDRPKFPWEEGYQPAW